MSNVNRSEKLQSTHSFVKAKHIVDTYSIPPNPEVINLFSAELSSKQPQMRALANIVAIDPALTAMILQIVNSPVYALDKKVTSIPKAVEIIGLNRLNRLKKVLVEQAAETKGIQLNRFWDCSREIAYLSKEIASILTSVNPDDAYITGLLSDCGIPLLMQAYPDYRSTLIESTQHDIVPLTALEDERHGLNHCTIGAMLCDKWFLPQHITKAVYYHHQCDVFQENEGCIHTKDDPSLLLIAVVKVAEHISDLNRRFYRTNETGSKEWSIYGPAILSYLGFTLEDFDVVERELLEELQSLQAA